MNEETKPLEEAAMLHASKLVGLTKHSLFEVVEAGSKVVVIAKTGHDLGAEGARLLLRLEEQELWVAAASAVSVIGWLADDGVLAICSDELSDVRLARDTLADQSSMQEKRDAEAP